VRRLCDTLVASCYAAVQSLDGSTRKFAEHREAVSRFPRDEQRVAGRGPPHGWPDFFGLRLQLTGPGGRILAIMRSNGREGSGGRSCTTGRERTMASY